VSNIGHWAQFEAALRHRMDFALSGDGYGVSLADCSDNCDGVAGAVFGSFHAWSQTSHMKKSKSRSFALSKASCRVSDEWQARQGTAPCGAVAMPI
jgi:hypothetical protein